MMRRVCLLVAAAAAGLAGEPCVGGRAVDPSYVSIAEGTGGHLYLFGPGEVAQSGSLMAWHHKHRETVFRAMGEMRQPAREFSFPVDSMADSLVVTVSLQCKESVAILDPSGAEAAGERLEFRAGKAVMVVHPAPGAWKLRLAGRGLFFVTVEAAGELSLDEARFVEPGGRPGHEGLFPMKTPPVLGSAGLLELGLSKAVRSLNVSLVDSEAKVLDRGDLSDGVARFPALRHAAFRVAVEGVDERGWPFMRMQAPLTKLTAAAAAR